MVPSSPSLATLHSHHTGRGEDNLEGGTGRGGNAPAGEPVSQVTRGIRINYEKAKKKIN